ncbi:hypothetical protein E4U11_002928 [Claviceps purpurea]|nr:hypothetical protein E4U11_002928 [Claviceps purpurea]
MSWNIDGIPSNNPNRCCSTGSSASCIIPFPSPTTQCHVSPSAIRDRTAEGSDGRLTAPDRQVHEECEAVSTAAVNSNQIKAATNLLSVPSQRALTINDIASYCLARLPLCLS